MSDERLIGILKLALNSDSTIVLQRVMQDVNKTLQNSTAQIEQSVSQYLEQLEKRTNPAQQNATPQQAAPLPQTQGPAAQPAAQQPKGEKLSWSIPTSVQQRLRNSGGNGAVEFVDSTPSRSVYEAVQTSNGYEVEPLKKVTWGRAIRSIMALDNLFDVTGDGNKIKSVTPAKLDSNKKLVTKGKVTLG